MNINDLTIGQFRELSTLFSASQPDKCGLNDMVGRHVIVRTYSAGVWFGLLDQKSGNEVILTQARRMWRWRTKKSISLSSIAIHGIDEERSKICEPVASQWLEAIEITPCENAAIVSIGGAKNAKAG